MSKKHSEEDNNNIEPFYHETESFRSAYFGEIPEQIIGTPQPGEDKKLFSTFLGLLQGNTSPEVRREMLEILRKNNAQQLIIDLLENPAYSKYTRELLVVAWESGLVFHQHILPVVKHAIQGDYACALEGLTVIEQIEESRDLSQLDEALAILKAQPVSDKTPLIDLMQHHLQRIKFNLSTSNG
jgi:hypothetical protein